MLSYHTKWCWCTSLLTEQMVCSCVFKATSRRSLTKGTPIFQMSIEVSEVWSQSFFCDEVKQGSENTKLERDPTFTHLLYLLHNYLIEAATPWCADVQKPHWLVSPWKHCGFTLWYATLLCCCCYYCVLSYYCAFPTAAPPRFLL